MMTKLNQITETNTQMLKKRCLILLFTIIPLLSVYSQTAPIVTQEDIIATKKTIIAYGKNSFPPFEYKDENGNNAGFNVELFDSIMKELNVEYELRLAPWDTVVAEMDSNRADVIIGMVNGPDQYNYCDPSLYGFDDIVCRSDFEFYKIEDIKGKKILLNTNDHLMSLYSRLNKDNEIIAINSTEDGFKLLAEGKYDAMFCTNHLGRHYVNKHDYTNLQLRHINKFPYNFSIAVNKNNPQLREDLNNAFETIRNKGIYDKIYVKWFEARMDQPIKHISNLVYPLGIIALILLLFITFRLRRKIKKARRTIFKQNEQMQLAIKAGDIHVWGFDVKSGLVYNIVGEVVPDGGVTVEEANKTIHEDDVPLLMKTMGGIITGDAEPESIVVRTSFNVEGWHYIRKEFVAIKDANGVVVTIIGTHKDINDDIIAQSKREGLLNKYQTVFDASPVGLEIYDKNGIVIDYNDSEAEILGISALSKEDILGRKLSLYNNPCYAAAIPYIKENKKYEGIVEYDFDAPSKNGIHIDSKKSGKRYVQIKITPIVNAQGELENIVCASVDVTDTIDLNKRLEHINKEKDFIIEMLPLGLAICDIDGINVFINQANAQILEVESIEEYIGRRINLFDSRIIEQNIIDSVKKNTSGEFLMPLDFEHIKSEDIYNTKASGVKFLKVNYRQIKNESTGIDYYMMMIRDVTENHKYHTAIEAGKRKMDLAVQSSNLFQWDYNNSTDVIILVGVDGERFELNHAQLIARIHAEDKEKAMEMMALMKRGDDKTFNFDVKIKAMTSDDINFISINGAPLQYDENGRVISYTGFRRNNTDWFNLNEELKTQNEMNRMILDNINSGLVYVDINHKVIWENVSDKFPITSYEGKQMFTKGLKCEDTHSLFKPKCDECLIDMAVHDKKHKISEKTLPNGSVVEIIASTIKGADGEVKGSVLRVDNISERKRLYNELELSKKNAESAHELLSEILDRTPCSIFIKDVDNQFKYILANKYFCKVSNFVEGDMIGKNDFDLFNKETAERFKAMDLKVLEDRIPLTSIDGGLSDDENTHWSTTKSIIETHDGRKLLIGLGVDLTEIYNINRELKKAKDKAVQSDKLKSSFLANMSHEIRTPLNAIVGFSELLCDADEADKESYSKIIATNNDLLLRLINDILDLSKIDAGAVVLNEELFDFSQFFDEITLMMQQRMKNPDVKFIAENPYEKCMVQLDRSRIGQVILNYVTNAIKYTPSGYIKMSYKYENKGIKIIVEDSGIGIIEEKKAKVFGRFQKLDEFAQGTGLGLSICKAIMELHGGTVGFESQDGKGSKFWAWKPNVDEPIIKGSIGKESKSNFSLIAKQNVVYSEVVKHKVLIVEDDNTNYILLTSILKEKCKITRAINGLEAVNIVKAADNPFDIILMDINMPVMNGLDATTEIRKFNTKTPIIAVTGNVYESDKDKAFEAGCNGFVPKPIRNDVIKSEMQKNLRGPKL